MFPTLFCSLLYHTKQQLGTTTEAKSGLAASILYHTKQQPGTTTALFLYRSVILLYHTSSSIFNKSILNLHIDTIHICIIMKIVWGISRK